jgi:hypothetical protein
MKIEAIAHSDETAILDYHSRCFGRSYQATSAYLKWLYFDHPFAEAPAGLVLRDDEGRIVGCIHCMTMRAYNNERSFLVHSLQNLFVDPSYRSGAGQILVKRMMKGADVVLFPGVAESLARSYRALRYTEVRSWWGRKILRPFGTLIGIASHRSSLFAREWRNPSSEPIERIIDGLRVVTAPDSDLMRSLAARLSERDRATSPVHIGWDEVFVRWRFFDRRGPRHLVVEDPRDLKRFLIVSTGVRNGVRACRFIEAGCGIDVPFVTRVLEILRKLGCETVLTYTTCEKIHHTYAAAGLSTVMPSPTSFMVARPHIGVAPALTAGATDVGFESFNYGAL